MSDERLEIAVAVVLHDRKVLVQTRPDGASYAGFWEFPGGKIEPGEDAARCAERECLEELGVAVIVLEPFEVVKWEYPGRRVRVTFLLCRPSESEGQPRAEPREGQEVRWAGEEDLPKLRFLPANESVVRRLRALFTRAS